MRCVDSRKKTDLNRKTIQTDSATGKHIGKLIKEGQDKNKIQRQQAAYHSCVDNRNASRYVSESG